MRAVAVVGPSQSGKSTLIEGAAALEGARSQTLRMHGDTAITTFEFMGDPWAMLEAPGGHDSFSQVGPVRVPVGLLERSAANSVRPHHARR